MATITNPHNREIDFAAAHNLMDDQLCNAIASDLAPCSEQEFFDEYCRRHVAKYGSSFEPAKENPVW